MHWPIRDRILATGYALAGVIGVTVYWQIAGAPERRDSHTARELASGDPAIRRAAAWRVADDKLPGAAARIAQLVAAEPDARVREAYVYALGRVARPTHFAAAALLATTDPDPYVRHAAWLAAARMDADRFRDLAGQAPPRADPWDRIGRAYGFLEAGDFRGVDDLLKLAETGDEGQRRAASMALFRNVAPVLESVGRWPVESAVRDGQIWPPALISEVRARLASLDAQRIVNELRRHARRVNQVRYLAGRLHIARDRLAWLLGAAPPREE